MYVVYLVALSAAAESDRSTHSSLGEEFQRLLLLFLLLMFLCACVSELVHDWDRWSSFFLIFTSLMLLEKRLDAKFEGRKDYEDYKARTSVLVPWALLRAA